MSDLSSYTKAETFVRSLLRSGSSMELPPKLPIGAELVNVLRAWLEHAESALKSKYPPLLLLKWAISGRTKEVLILLDESNNPLDYQVAKVIRRIAAKDRSSWGYIASVAYGHHGWLGKELGNQTWVLKQGWHLHHGNAEVLFIERYSQLCPAVLLNGKIYTGTHGEAHQDVMDRYGIPVDLTKDQRGFVTADGEYLDREAAFRWAF